MDFIYIKIPVSETLASQAHTLHEALETALAAESAGAVIGWGASLEGVPDGRPARVAFHRIDIEAAQVDRARAVLRQALSAFGVAPGSELHFTQAGAQMLEVLGVQGWGPPQALGEA